MTYQNGEGGGGVRAMPSAGEDHDPYWEYDDAECWNCDGEGFVYGCSWDWQCSTYDEGEGTCLCARRCYVCRPSEPDPKLQAVLSRALSSAPNPTPNPGEPHDQQD